MRNDSITKYIVFVIDYTVSVIDYATVMLHESAVASWLMRSSPERVVLVRALAGDIVLCSWARHLTLTVPLSTQVLGKPNKLRCLRWTSILSRGSRNTPSRFMLQKPGLSSGSYGPLGSKGFIFFSMLHDIRN